MWKKLDDSFSTDDRFDGLDACAALVFLLILPHADCAGRFPANPRLIKAKVAPLIDAIDADAVPGLLRALKAVGLIRLYAAGGRDFLAIIGHDQLNPQANLKHARPSHPAPPDESPSGTGSASVSNDAPSSSSGAVVVPHEASTEGGTVRNGASLSPSHLSLEGGCREETDRHPRYAEAAECAKAWQKKNGEGMGINAAAQHFIRALVAGVPVPAIVAAIEKSPGVDPWHICDPLRKAVTTASQPKTKAQRQSEEYLNDSG